DGPIFLELNTLPGLTRVSLVTQALAYEGISMRGFLLNQVEIADARVS
ncbi:MAG: D-alanine--D-alanine ligase, partial [Deltaproteobacteria bacterium]|nr:D-alanine--D-alanine ligase [Deltaproteobacteria bacterium]